MERSRLKHNAYVNPAPLSEFTYPNNHCTKYGMTNEKYIHTLIQRNINITQDSIIHSHITGYTYT